VVDSDGQRLCYHCRRPLAADHSADDFWCSPCRSTYRRTYDPHSDPAFLSELLLCLSERPGEVVEPLKLLGLSEDDRGYLKSCIRRLRNDGAVICAEPRKAGYRFVGFVTPTHAE
jgi:hypothetical protein